MNFPLPEEENFKITDNYYLAIKQISEDFIRYITNFKIYSNEYIRKISAINEKFNIKNMSKIYKEMGYDKINMDHLILLSSIIPSIIEQQIINFDFFINGIDTKIEKFKNIYNEKSSKYLLQFKKYKEIKSELCKKYPEIEKLKVNYINNISLVEEMIHNFYIKKNFNKKRLNSTPIPELKENKKEQINNNITFATLEEQINTNIQKVKKIEDDYKLNAAILKSIEDNYIKIANDTAQSTSSVSRIIQKVKNKYDNYKTLEMAKLKLFKDK